MAQIPGTKKVVPAANKVSPKDIDDVFSDSDVSFVGDPVPAGQYTLRAANGQVKFYDERPFVTARITVTEGPMKGKGYEETFWIDHEKQDGSPSASLNFTLGKLVVMFGGIPADVRAAGKLNKSRLAEAIVSAINTGPEFIAAVGMQTYEDKTGTERTRNNLIATRPKNWQPK